MWGLILFIDPRREFHVATVNAGKFEISHAKSQFDDWYTGGGWLYYGDESTESNVRHSPPTSARVSWKKGEVRFDRSVDIEGSFWSVGGRSDLPTLFVEIDSDCGRARVSWQYDNDKIVLATPYKHVLRDCSIYSDRATPPDAPPWPPNW